MNFAGEIWAAKTQFWKFDRSSNWAKIFSCFDQYIPYTKCQNWERKQRIAVCLHQRRPGRWCRQFSLPIQLSSFILSQQTLISGVYKHILGLKVVQWIFPASTAILLLEKTSIFALGACDKLDLCDILGRSYFPVLKNARLAYFNVTLFISAHKFCQSAHFQLYWSLILQVCLQTLSNAISSVLYSIVSKHHKHNHMSSCVKNFFDFGRLPTPNQLYNCLSQSLLEMQSLYSNKLW